MGSGCCSIGMNAGGSQEGNMRESEGRAIRNHNHDLFSKVLYLMWHQTRS